jgi:hypothetical protein
MAIFSLANRTTNTTTANATIELIAGASARFRLIETGIFMGAATASIFLFGRPAAIGITPTSPISLLPEDPADSTPGCKTALAWGTSPTAPTASMRRVNLPGTIGAGLILTFPRGITVAANGTLVYHNSGATGVSDIYFVADE